MRTSKMAIGVGVVLVLIVVALLLFRPRGGAKALTASGTVEATEALLGFTAPGRIEAVTAQEGDPARAGDTLARLDRREMDARLGQARAAEAAARAVLRELEAGSRKEEVAQGRAALTAAQRREDEARLNLERTERLLAGGAVGQEAYDRALVARDVAASDHARAADQLRLLEAGPRRERIVAQRAQVHQAEAAVRALEASLSTQVVVAPFDGLVTVRHHEPGEIVPAGAPVLTLLSPADRWVRIYVPENQIGAVALQQPAEITTDTYPDSVFAGRVTFIASQAEFTPKSVQTAQERVKLVYAVKVTITGDAAFVLKPGMPADVRLGARP